MRQAALIDRLACLFVLGVVAVIALFAASEDALFFHSDPRSVVVVSSVLGLGLAVVAALAGLALRPIPAARGLAALPVLGVPALVLATIALFVLDFLQGEFKIFGLFKRGYDEVVCLVLALAVLVWAGRSLSRHRDRAALEARVVRLCRVAAPLILAALAVLVVEGRTRRAAAGTPRHVVVVVLDGWPAQYLHTFNPDAPPRGVDSLFAGARVYRAMHTNATWTHGYFGALYLGSTAGMHEGRAALHFVARDGGARRWDLWSALQRLGVTTRWVVFHQNGIPESRAVAGYRGFRSILLTHRFAPFLRSLGLDYHVLMCGAASRKMAATPRRRALFNPLNRGADAEDALGDVLLPEMRALRARADRTFLLLHAGWTAGPVSLPAAWDEAAPKTEQERLVARIKREENRYGSADEWYAAELRDRTAHYTGVLAGRIERFIARARAEGLLDDTMLILTADHGHMFERGRAWYGYHPDEEVSRVPLVVFAPGLSGVDETPRETVDLTRTVVEAFGGEIPHPRATSILDDGGKPLTVTLTLPAPLHREWFLVLHRGGRRYVCNLAAGGDGACVATDAAGRDTLAAGDAALDEIRTPLRGVLRELALAPEELHPSFAGLAGDPAPAGDRDE